MQGGRGNSDRWFCPRTLAEASSLAGEHGAVLVAGGCEIAAQRERPPLQSRTLVDLRTVGELPPLFAHPKKGLRIGALTTIAQTSNHLWVAKRWAALHEATEQFASPQARNTATVVGNICAGDPRYDLATALLALRADVRIYRRSAILTVGLNEFYRSSGDPVLDLGDIVTGISAPPQQPDAGSAFRKLQLMQRHADDIPKVSIAAAIALDPAGASIVDATVAMGGNTRAPLRLADVESHLLGKPPSAGTFEQAGQITADTLRDIDCIAPFKLRLARALVRDVVEQAVSRARSRHDPFEDASELLRDSSDGRTG